MRVAEFVGRERGVDQCDRLMARMIRIKQQVEAAANG